VHLVGFTKKYILRCTVLQASNSDVPFGVLKSRKFHDELSNYQLLGNTLYLGVVTAQF